MCKKIKEIWKLWKIYMSLKFWLYIAASFNRKSIGDQAVLWYNLPARKIPLLALWDCNDTVIAFAFVPHSCLNLNSKRKKEKNAIIYLFLPCSCKLKTKKKNSDVFFSCYVTEKHCQKQVNKYAETVLDFNYKVNKNTHLHTHKVFVIHLKASSSVIITMTKYNNKKIKQTTDKKCDCLAKKISRFCELWVTVVRTWTLFSEYFFPVIGGVYLTTVCWMSHTDNSTEKWHFLNCPTQYFQFSVRRIREYVVKTIRINAATEYYFNYIVIYSEWCVNDILSTKITLFPNMSSFC